MLLFITMIWDLTVHHPSEGNLLRSLNGDVWMDINPKNPHQNICIVLLHNGHNFWKEYILRFLKTPPFKNLKSCWPETTCEVLQWHLKSGYKFKLWDYFWSTISKWLDFHHSHTNQGPCLQNIWMYRKKRLDWWFRFHTRNKYQRFFILIFMCKYPEKKGNCTR